MPYTLRRTWPDRDREDFVIHCEGLDIGRVYLTPLPEGDRFLWTIYMNGHVPQIAGVPISGYAIDARRGSVAVQAELRGDADQGRDCQGRSGVSSDPPGCDNSPLCQGV